MSEQTDNIVGLVEAIVLPLIEHADDFEVSAQEREDGSILIEMRVNEEDAGKVIGRQGRIIKSIRTLARAAAARTLARAAAARTGVHVDVELLD